MEKETHNKSIKINSIILVISILLIATFFTMMIFFRDFLKPFIIPFLLLGLGLLGLIYSIIQLITKSLKSIDTNKFPNKKTIIISTSAFTIISTMIFRFSWFILITLLIINLSLIILTFGVHKNRIKSSIFKTEKQTIKLKNLLFLLILIIFLFYLSKFSPFKYYGLLSVYSISLITSVIFKNRTENFLKKIEKLPKKKSLEMKETLSYRANIFLFLIPVIIDINFSILYVSSLIHIIVVGLYILLYFSSFHIKR